MTRIATLNRIVQRYGRGTAARIIGQSYSVYRMNPNTSGSVISPNSLVYPTFSMYFKNHQRASKVHVENTVFDLMIFEGMCDGTKLQVGDFLVENGYESDAGVYCVGQLRPMSQNILVRVESPSTLEKPHPDAGASEDQPTSGFVYVQGKYGGVRPAGRFELTLQGGLYSMQAQGEGILASVPIGLQPINRVSDSHKPPIPMTFPRTKFLCYIPPLPGYIINELDVVKMSQADSYQVSMMYSSADCGLQGFICTLEKINA